MLRQRRVIAAASMALASLALAGCAIVDKYSDRAVEYNLQAEKTQQQNLLLNIIRASLRRPMQFTGLSSITGNATASGGMTGGVTKLFQTPLTSLANLPVTSGSTVIARSVTSTGSGTASLSGGQTFTVPVLDTQEFYQGILTPVSPQVVDYYVQQGFPPQLLFDLFILSVEVIAADSPSCERFVFRNSVRNELQFGQFQALADYLLGSGFTTEHYIESLSFGPAIAAPKPETQNVDTPAQMIDAYSKAATAGLSIRADGNGYHLQKRANRFRFCFARSGSKKPTWLGTLEDKAYCGYATARQPASKGTQNQQAPRCGTASDEQGAAEGGSSQFHGILLSELFLNRLQQVQQAHAANNYSPEDVFPIKEFRNKNKHVTFKFQTRSVEGILYYLGEITRQYLRPEFGSASRLIQIKNGLRYGNLPMSECNLAENGGRYQEKHDLRQLTGRHALDGRSYSCENLFVLETDREPGSIYSVQYDGMNYTIPNDPERTGRSLQVLELIKQLLALHTSAKQLPQSSVISIVGGTAQ
jgi:hypothetical protein